MADNRAGTAPVHLCGRFSWLLCGQALEKVHPYTGCRFWEAAVHLCHRFSSDYRMKVLMTDWTALELSYFRMIRRRSAPVACFRQYVR